MKHSLFAVICFVLLISPSYQLGTLYLNRILANSDNRVRFEEVEIRSSTIYLGQIQPLSSTSISIGNVVINNQDIESPQGLLLVDGNLLAQDIDITGNLYGYDTQFDYKYVIDSNGNFATSGSAEITETINIQESVSIGDDGQTTISDSLLKPNGGFVVGEGVFVVDSNTGDFLASGDVTIGLDLFLGSPKAQDIFITRQESTSGVGGDTFITGQLGLNQGGDVYLIPGISQDLPFSNGHIIFGREQADNLFVGRTPLTSLFASAGSTIITGQDSTIGSGGDLNISGGNSLFAKGGDLYLEPGHSMNNQNSGTIYLGPLSEATIDSDLIVSRKTVSGRANPTTFAGQSSIAGLGGDLFLAAGNSTTGTGGDLYLIPGSSYSFNTLRNYIVLSADDNQQVTFGRQPTDQAIGSNRAGDTHFVGQSSVGGNGGLLALYAGDASIHDKTITANGGDLILTHGASAGTNQKVGTIFIGDSNFATLTVERQRTSDIANELLFVGQASSTGSGGDFLINGGFGGSSGGNLVFANNQGFSGGDLALQAGDGPQKGGDITLKAGVSISSPGHVYINGDFGIAWLSGGSSAAQSGSISIDSQTSLVTFNTDTFSINSANLIISRSNNAFDNDQVVFSADPQQLINVNGQTILKERQGNVAVVTDIRPDLSENIARLQSSLLTLLNALGPCGHGLLSFGEAVGLPVTDCIVPSPVYTTSN